MTLQCDLRSLTCIFYTIAFRTTTSSFQKLLGKTESINFYGTKPEIISPSSYSLSRWTREEQNRILNLDLTCLQLPVAMQSDRGAPR